MELPSGKRSVDPATGHTPAKPVPGAADMPPDDEVDLDIGEEVFRRPVETITPGPSSREKRRPMNNDLNPPPTEAKEVETRKKRKNPLEKRTGPPLNQFKRVVRPRTSFAASTAVDHARAESPAPLESVNHESMEFGKVHYTSATPDYRPNKLHSVLDSAYKHTRLGWLDWVDRIGPRTIIAVVLLLTAGGFLAWRYFGSFNDQAVTVPMDTGVKINSGDRIARGKQTVEQFLAAKTNEVRLPLVMDPERAGPRMEQFYGSMGGRNPNISSWEVGTPIGSSNGDWLPLTFTDEAGRKVTVALGETATGCILDWENFVSFGDMPWAEFCRTKSAAPKALRVRLRKVERYEGTYTKEAWQAYEVQHRSGGPQLTAYCSRAGRFARDLEELIGGDRWQCALVFLRFDPATAGTGDKVVIEGLVRSRWQDEATSWTGP
jgi:hypothetical protein